jgi:hypothetical protein
VSTVGRIDAGVASSEASFTHPHDEPGQLRRQRWRLIAHYDEPTTTLRGVIRRTPPRALLAKAR